MSVYGAPRTIHDLDVILDIKANKEEMERFLEVMKKYDLETTGGAEHVITSLQEKSHFTIFYKSYAYWIDAQGVYGPLDEFAMKPRRQMRVFGENTWVEAPEVLIIAKLSAYYSDQSLRDMISILEVSVDEIDFGLLRRIAEKWNTKKIEGCF